jgi:hypothetical protein
MSRVKSKSKNKSIKSTNFKSSVKQIDEQIVNQILKHSTSQKYGSCKRPDVRTRGCPRTRTLLHLLACYACLNASRSAPVPAGPMPAGLLHPERATAVVLACALCAPRVLLLGSRVLLLRLHGRACAWGLPAACKREVGAYIARVPVLTPAACSTMGTQPCGAGTPSSMSIRC